jgi:hypothetical protein
MHGYGNKKAGSDAKTALTFAFTSVKRITFLTNMLLIKNKHRIHK